MQLGLEGRVALNVRDLSRIEVLCVNGVSYEIWSDLTRTLFDVQGEKVPGIFEFIPEIEEDAVNVRVSPQDETFTAETVLSTFAHELGHAVFDGPALIVLVFHFQETQGTFEISSVADLVAVQLPVVMPFIESEILCVIIQGFIAAYAFASHFQDLIIGSHRI